MSRLLEMPDASAAARPPRPRDPRAVLRLGPAPERAGRAGRGRREPERRGSCGCWGRAARSGSCRSTARPRRRCAPGCRTAGALRAAGTRARGRQRVAAQRRGREGPGRPEPRPRAARPAREPLFLNYRGGTRLSTRSVRPAGAALRRGVQHALRHQPARAAPLVRDAPAASAAPICARSRSCSATRASARRSATPT